MLQKGDTNIKYEFCVAHLGATVKTKVTSLEKLADLSIQLAKFNTTNVISDISKLLAHARRLD